MNKLKAGFILSVVAVMAACTPNAGDDKVPSVKGDYKDQYDFIQASLDSTIQVLDRETKLPDDQYRFLNSKLDGLLAIVPVSGLYSQNKTYDSLDSDKPLTEDWSVKIREASIWSMCMAPTSLNSSLELRMGDQYFYLKPNSPNAYVIPRGQSFDYDHHDPQFHQSFDSLITEKFEFSWGTTQTNSTGCYPDRIVIEYRGTHQTVVDAVQNFKKEVQAVQQDLSSLRYASGTDAANFPLKYALKKEAERLRNAYSKLP